MTTLTKTQKSKPAFREYNKVLVGFESGPGHSGSYFVPGEVLEHLGIKDIRMGGGDFFIGRTHFYRVKENGSEWEKNQFLLALNPLDLDYVNNGLLMDEALQSFYQKGARVLAHVNPYECPDSAHRTACFLPGLITEEIGSGLVIPVGFKLSSTNTLETLFGDSPRLFKVSLDEGGEVFQFQHMITPNPNHKESMGFYSETFPRMHDKYFSR